MAKGDVFYHPRYGFIDDSDGQTLSRVQRQQNKSGAKGAAVGTGVGAAGGHIFHRVANGKLGSAASHAHLPNVLGGAGAGLLGGVVIGAAHGRDKGLRREAERSGMSKRDKRGIKDGQRVRTFNGKKATIERKDYSGSQRFGHYLDQAVQIGNGTRQRFETPAHREAWAKPDHWWSRTGIRPTSTTDKGATRLTMVDRSNRSRGAQRVAQGAAGSALFGAVSYGIHAGSKHSGVKTALGATVGGGLAQVFRPSDRKLMFEQPVRKGEFTIPARQISQGGKAGVKRLQATGRQVETHLWNKVGAQPPKPVLRALKGEKTYDLGSGMAKSFSKRSEWQTIDQRERKAAKARKTQRRGVAAVGLGGTVAGSALYRGHSSFGPNLAVAQAKNIREGLPLVAQSPGISAGTKIKYAARGLRANSLGSALVGGAGLAGVGAVGWGQGRAREAYHQNKINSRRKANMSKADTMDYPNKPSGYARYGNNSGVGRKQVDEFSKSESVSKRVRNKDAESDRQRRLGAGIAAAGLGSAALLARGGKGAINSTKLLRGRKNLGVGLKNFADHRNAEGKLIAGRGVAASYGDLAQIAGGTALGAGAVGTAQYARSVRNRRWE